MKLVKVAPSRRTLVEVLIHRLRNKLICDVHCNLSKVFAHVFQNDAHYTAVRFDVGTMIDGIAGITTPLRKSIKFNLCTTILMNFLKKKMMKSMMKMNCAMNAVYMEITHI